MDGRPDEHDIVVAGTFDTVSGKAGNYELGMTTPARKRTANCRQSKDDSHGGRRILVDTAGKRTQGQINFSLRTMKPSTNTW